MSWVSSWLKRQAGIPEVHLMSEEAAWALIRPRVVDALTKNGMPMAILDMIDNEVKGK